MAKDWATTRYGYNWRGPKSAPQIKDEKDVTPCGESVEDYIESLRWAAAKLDNACIETNTIYGSYGDSDYDVVVLCGWRDAMKAEISAAEKVWQSKSKSIASSVKAQADAAEALLRKTRPELFKD